MEPGLELRKRNVRNVAVVKDGKRQTKLGAKLFETHLGALRLHEDVVGGLPDGRQIIHQRARPIEDDIPNHGWSLTGFGFTAALGNCWWSLPSNRLAESAKGCYK